MAKFSSIFAWERETFKPQWYLMYRPDLPLWVYCTACSSFSKVSPVLELNRNYQFCLFSLYKYCLTCSSCLKVGRVLLISTEGIMGYNRTTKHNTKFRTICRNFEQILQHFNGPLILSVISNKGIESNLYIFATQCRRS